MFIGTQYYRPPNPPRERWEQDLAMIKEHGLELIRLWAVWSYVNPAEGQWVWDDYDELFELARRNGLKVLLQFVHDTPDWLRARHAGEHACDCSPGIDEHYADYIGRLIERYKGRPNLHAYDIWNEPGSDLCKCEHTNTPFREFAKEKYGDIENLNITWHRHYGGFEDIDVRLHCDAFDGFEFRQWFQKRRMRWLRDTARQHDADRPLASHGHGNGSYLIFPDHDQWNFTESVDVWGCGFYEHTLPEAVFPFHGVQASCEGKRWWLSECQCGSHWNNVGYYKTSPTFLKSLFVLAMAYGADGVIYWQWAPQMHGFGETPHFGMTGLNSEGNERTEMVKRLTGMLHRHRDLFDRMEFPTPQAALLWEPRTVIYDEIAGSTHFDKLWERNFIGWHKALTDSTHPFDIQNARRVAERGLPNDLKILFAPTLVFDRAGLLDKLRAWVEDGGTLVTGPMAAVYDDQQFVNGRYPPEWFGVKQREMDYAPEFTATFTHDDLKRLAPLTAPHFIECLAVEDADVLAVVGDRPLITRRKVGKGQVVYVGGFLGEGYETSAAVTDFVRSLTAGVGLTPLLPSSSGCVIHTAKAGADTLIFLTNPKDLEVDVRLTFPELEGTLTDLLTDDTIGEITQSSRPVRLHLDAEDSQLLALHPH